MRTYPMYSPSVHSMFSPSPWVRSLAHVAMWWTCATLLVCLHSGRWPVQGAFGAYWLLLAPAMVVSLAGLFSFMRTRLSVAAPLRLALPATRVLATLEIAATVASVILFAR